jgi:hypothetical protein
MLDTAAIAKTWVATTELRWLRPKPAVILNGVEPSFYDQPLVLQQKWICRETGDIEWRDLPVVVE